MQHFLDIHKSAPEALRQIIDQAMEMKNDRAGQPRAALDRGRPLAGQMVALIFEKPSTRTRISFDVGVRQMGGETMVSPPIWRTPTSKLIRVRVEGFSKINATIWPAKGRPRSNAARGCPARSFFISIAWSII